jgi:hypothetical protein
MIDINLAMNDLDDAILKRNGRVKMKEDLEVINNQLQNKILDLEYQLSECKASLSHYIGSIDVYKKQSEIYTNVSEIILELAEMILNDNVEE